MDHQSLANLVCLIVAIGYAISAGVRWKTTRRPKAAEILLFVLAEVGINAGIVLCFQNAF